MADRFKMQKHPYGALVIEKVVDTLNNWFEFFRSPDFQYNAGKRTGVTMRVGDIDAGNYAEVESDGTLAFKGDATVWDDFRFPFTQTKRGSLLKPDFDFTNVGLLFPQNDAAEIVYMIGQLPHNYKEGTSIYPHTHWVQSQADVPVWKLDYKWYNRGELIPGAFTTITSTTEVYPYSAGNIFQKTTFPAIVPSATQGDISSFLDMKFYRDDNVVAGDVLGKEFDIHYEIDTIGSRTILDK